LDRMEETGSAGMTEIRKWRKEAPLSFEDKHADGIVETATTAEKGSEREKEMVSRSASIQTSINCLCSATHSDVLKIFACSVHE